jgi:DNA-binding response OmpR family regulator
VIDLSHPAVALGEQVLAIAPAAPLCVLLVEDDALIGDLLRELITDMGHHVCAIESTEAGAVAAASRFGPQLVIVDVGLAQGGSGIAAIDRIQRKAPVSSVLMTGGTLQTGLGGRTILYKPFSTADLHRAMQLALQAPGARRID